jgi:zinc D-Ala-D-Ala carboxypeptidase
MKWVGWTILVSVILITAALINRKRVMRQLQNIRLSKNFTLDEFVVTATGLENIPGETEIENLRQLVEKILQPLRDAVGKPVVISSGYRSLSVNTAIGGAGTSQHLKGQAADFTIPGMTNEEIIARIRALRLPYDQVIDELKAGKRWIHVSYNPSRTQRLEWLTFRDGNYSLIKTGLA